MRSKKDGRRDPRRSQTGRALLLRRRVQPELDAHPQGYMESQRPASDDPDPCPTQKALWHWSGQLPYRPDGGLDPPSQAPPRGSPTVGGSSGKAPDGHRLRGLGQRRYPRGRRDRGGAARGGGPSRAALPAHLQSLAESHRDALRHFRREVTHCELFPSVKALIAAAYDFFDRYNRCPWRVLSIIGSDPAEIT